MIDRSGEMPVRSQPPHRTCLGDAITYVAISRRCTPEEASRAVHVALGAGTLWATAVVFSSKSSIDPVPVPSRVWTRYSSWGFHREARIGTAGGFADAGLGPAYR